ncbi:MAG: adenylyl-sulfate kinase [Planctomycetota bacterium]
MSQRGPIVPPPEGVTRAERERLLGQRGLVLWLTGLSGAGKSTLARALERALHDRGRACYVLDGDTLRTGLNEDLGFSPADRRENVRRLGEVAALFASAGLIVVVSAISPYAADRERARRRAGPASFREVHVAATLDLCRARDPKGLYARAAQGELPDLTGLTPAAPYEPPTAPDLRLDTGTTSLPDCLAALLALLEHPPTTG